MSAQPINYKTNTTINRYHHKQSWWQITRPLTLTGTISPIIVGTLVALKYGSIHFDTFIILIVAAVLVQSGVNILNDYFDFANGQDQEKWYIPQGDEQSQVGLQHKYLLYIAITMFIIASILGLWLAAHSHVIIILIGITGIYAGYKYSAGGTKSFSALGLGEITAAIFLGIVPVILSFIVQDQILGWNAFAISLLFSILISMMILTNNIRDINKDIGFRQTIAIRIGKTTAIKLLKTLMASSYVLITLLVVISPVFLWTTLIVYFALPTAYRLLKALEQKDLHAEKENVMKLVAKHHWIFSMLLIVGMLVDIFFFSH